jgi:hypothetical protein
MKSDQAPLSDFEPLNDPQHHTVALASAAVSIAFQWSASDLRKWVPPVPEQVGAALEMIDPDMTTFDALLGFLRAWHWPIAVAFEVGRLGTLALGAVRPSVGTAVVVGLAPKPGRMIGGTLVIVNRRPGHVYDPGPGDWRPCSGGDEALWFNSRRIVLVLRCL